MARVVGVDLGIVSAWACADTAYLVGWRPPTRITQWDPLASLDGLDWGEWDLGSTASWDRRYANFWRNLDELHDDRPIDVLAFETAGTFFKSAGALRSVFGLWVVCQTWCGVREVTPHPVQNHALKKHATGSGHADKPEVQAAAEALLGESVSEHEAEAVFCLDLCLTEWHRRGA